MTQSQTGKEMEREGDGKKKKVCNRYKDIIKRGIKEVSLRGMKHKREKI